jgi:hypothetical protein
MIQDIFGYIGMAIVLFSFTMNDVAKLRLTNLIGSIFWILYGWGIDSTPTIIVNTAVVMIHSYWFYKNTDCFDKFKK